MESLVYGLLFRLDPTFHVLWKRRHHDPKAAAKFKREGWSQALQLIEKENPNLVGGIRRQYETLIDLGAHPNVLGIDQMSEYFAEPGSDFGRAQYAMLLGQPNIDLSHINTGFCYSLLIEGYRSSWPELFSQFGLDGSMKKVDTAMVNFILAVRRSSTEAEIA